MHIIGHQTKPFSPNPCPSSLPKKQISESIEPRKQHESLLDGDVLASASQALRSAVVYRDLNGLMQSPHIYLEVLLVVTALVSCASLAAAGGRLLSAGVNSQQESFVEDRDSPLGEVTVGRSLLQQAPDGRTAPPSRPESTLDGVRGVARSGLVPYDMVYGGSKEESSPSVHFVRDGHPPLLLTKIITNIGHKWLTAVNI